MSRTTRDVRAILVTHHGGTQRIELDNKLVVGRSRECDVFIDSSQVSRRHATICVEGGHVVIEDLGSHNGTMLLSPVDDADMHTQTQTRPSSARRLPANAPTRLADDALVQIGAALITVEPFAPRIPQPEPGFVAVDPAMHRVLELADRVASSSLTVLLLGESGAGKDMLARYLHKRSPRSDKRLVSLNCGALPENLLESELFGYEKGAFTGATTAKPGLIETAHGGTLFLDEIGELTLALQVKLLRVLEDRSVQRVGALEPRTIDVRYVAATNRDLEQLVAAGKFREDLYYRINGMTLVVPALRERPADVVPLAEYFLADLAASQGVPTPKLAPAAADKLRGYTWPGNVRQLRNVVQRALVLASRPVIDASDIDFGDVPATDTTPLGDPDALRELADDVERKKILDAIEACAGNQTRAAEKLGITRRALVRRLEKYDLPRPRRSR